MKRNILLFCIFTLFLIPVSVMGNGGDQRVADGYLVNLSRSPFTPIAGTKTAMTVSFVDLATMRLIKDDAVVTVRIGKGRGSKTFLREDKELPLKGGVLEYSHTFQDSGLHELFFDFTFVNDPDRKVHELPDFLMDIQEPKVEKSSWVDDALLVLAGLFSGLLVSPFLRKKFTQKV